MPKPRLTLVCALVFAVSAGAATAAAANPPDPRSNFAGHLSCTTAARCLQGAIRMLDQARARLGEPPYSLPANFSQLTPAEQAFVLTNLDRVQSKLRPIPGLSAALDQASVTGVRLDRDPLVADPAITTFTSNWGGGYADMPLTYEAWMYDDGPGGPNLDCTALNRSGCWMHRHDVLWPFAGAGGVAMGAAAGTDARGASSYAMLLAQGGTGYHPAFAYTWRQALAAGAGHARHRRRHRRG